ncbi:NAD(P)-dependent dehydrogenase (short-subunit alcohol dehydrogenase family) [Bacillus thermophilus]|uniref:NAD(P)-dependent dehydrogenase (Short-subunit alcohol dehydrogenase family) n=1 Tax=Siminovitchia thermophila TaxID=1245522 RepID=A0ABS2R0T7_9BACI|nr:SDR family oxidoreductase UcpA [Siminovitchia thermophila]MBM7713256.1 NAD(P)-dependent dehydrogenase (short-subunit alcohol dehydrogenase family) [Siminovitchia thermophila]ONK21359.1 short-chain dehydrogenase [Bacillus sp. VT-16-64]
MGKMENKVVIVTGAAMGNGFGIAKVLAKYRGKVVLTDISSKVHEASKRLNEEGYETMAVEMDVSNPESINAAVKQVMEQYGRIDALVNNAGVIRLGSLLDTTNEDRDFQFNININGVWNVSKAVLPYMKEKKYGRIVNLSSVTGMMVADPGETAYATSKAAVIGFTKALAREVAEHGITVNAIMPGYIHTPMAEQIAHDSNPENPQEVIAGIASGVPLGRLGKIEEVGELAAFLASDESSYITGAQIVIDGGSSLPETVSAGV